MFDLSHVDLSVPPVGIACLGLAIVFLLLAVVIVLRQQLQENPIGQLLLEYETAVASRDTAGQLRVIQWAAQNPAWQRALERYIDARMDLDQRERKEARA